MKESELLEQIEVSRDGGQTIAEREAAILAPYAMHSIESAGRFHAETAHRYRGPFQRDRDRIVHCAAFRRLSNKTQVFTGEPGDFHRTRLTHTLEVASIARSIGRALRLNEDLIEALALLHDIGHPPFGHAGEDVLNECLRECRGFNHNQQALRIVEKIEQRYAGFSGLNLSHEVLEGQTRRANKKSASKSADVESALPASLQGSALLEVQVVDIADSIAYNTHDADDAIELGLLTHEALLEVPLWKEATHRVLANTPELFGDALRRAILHELIDWHVSDCLQASTERLQMIAPRNAAAVREAKPLVKLSPALAQEHRTMKKFLYENVYRHQAVVTKREIAQAALRSLFTFWQRNGPDALPSPFATIVENEGPDRAIGDFLASMTDRYALKMFRELE